MLPQLLGVLLMVAHNAQSVNLVSEEEVEFAWNVNEARLILTQKDCLFLFGGAKLIAVPEWKNGIEFEWQPIVYPGKEGGQSAEIIVTFCATESSNGKPQKGISLFLRADGNCSVVSTWDNKRKELSRFSILAWTSFGRWGRVRISTDDDTLVIYYDDEVVSKTEGFIIPSGHTSWSIEVPAPAVEALPNSVMLRLLQQR